MSPNQYADERLLPVLVVAANASKSDALAGVPRVQRFAISAAWPIFIRYVLPFLLRLAVQIAVKNSWRFLPMLRSMAETMRPMVRAEYIDEIEALIGLLSSPEAVHPAVTFALARVPN